MLDEVTREGISKGCVFIFIGLSTHCTLLKLFTKYLLINDHILGPVLPAEITILACRGLQGSGGERDMAGNLAECVRQT